MDRSLQQTANEIVQNRERRRWWQRAVTVMASVVVFCTMYALIMPAVTKEGQTYCGIDDHEHTLQCFSDPTADIESEDVWERNYAVSDSTFYLPENVVMIAEKQVGYEESSRNYLVAEDGENLKGYTRYGAWAGRPYDDWNASFCAFCLNYAGIDPSLFPIADTAGDWIDILSAEDCGRFRTAEDYTPKAGDLIFLRKEPADHVGIVTEVTGGDETGNAAKLRVAEGDDNDKVSVTVYEIGDEQICGYGETPETAEQTGVRQENVSDRDSAYAQTRLGNGGASGTEMAAQYDSMYSSSLDLPEDAMNPGQAQFSWQVVSGDYGEIKAGDGTYTYDTANNSAVRIQKAVIPTDEENEFQIYLNVEPQMSWQEFLRSLDNYQTHNSSSSFNPSSGCSQLLTPDQYESLPDQPGSDGEYKGLYTPFTVDYVDNSVSPAKHYSVTRYGNFTGNGKNAIQAVKNGSYCFSSEKFSYNGLQTHIDWPALIRNPQNGLTVDISELKRNFTFAEEPVYPKTVTDPMGDLINYEGMITYDGGSYEAPSDNNQQVLTWTLPTVDYPDWPYYSTHTEEGLVPGTQGFYSDVTYVDNVVPVMLNGKQTLYYTDVLEMRYAVSLDTENVSFVSADPLDDPPTDAIYPTNKTTTLDYMLGSGTNKSVNFTIPSVIGVLRSVNVLVKKTDSTDPAKLLAGASFTVFEAADSTDEDAVPVPGTTTLYGIKKDTIKTGADGLTPIFALPLGKTFYLVENIAPHRYIREEKPIALSVQEVSGENTLSLLEGEDFASNCSVEQTDDAVFCLIVTNVEQEHITPTPPPDVFYPELSREVTLSKQIDYLKDNQDGGTYAEDLYRLYLTMESDEEPVDLLFVLDQSGSMNNTLSDTIPAEGELSRQDYVISLLNGSDNGNGLIKEFLELNSKNDLAILTFGTDCSDNRYIRHWGETGNTVSLDTPEGATNYTAALDIANNVWAEKETSTNKKIMVFLSDGQPTIAYADNQMHHSFAEGNAIGTGSSGYANIVTRLNLFLTYCNYEIDPHIQGASRRVFFENGLTDDEGNVTPILRWYRGDGAGYPVMFDLLTADLNIPGISEFPDGEIDEVVFTDWYNNSWRTWDNEQRLSWIENNISYYGDSYDIMYQCQYAFYDFQTQNPDVKTYTIGYSDSTAVVYADNRTADEVLKYMSGENCFYQCSTASDLEAALRQIITFGNVQMTDDLSAYAEPADDPNLTITMKYGEENLVLYENGVFTADGENYLDTSIPPIDVNGCLTVAFKPDFTIGEDFECIAAFNIRPTIEAYSEYSLNGYNAVGDMDTDYQDNETSYGKEGFFSNGTAFASWKTGGESAAEDFDKPVIQVHAVKLTITKQVSGSVTEEAFPFEVSATNGLIIPPAAGSGYTLDDNGVAHFELAGGESVELLLQPGATALVSETEHDGYTQKIVRDGVPVSNTDYYEFVLNQNEELTVINLVGYELPHTGGVGTVPFYLGGSIIALAAILLLRKREALMN